MTITDGSFTTLLGPSGCGKTTLLRMISGLETPDSGSIWFDDACVFSKKNRINVPPEKRKLGFVFQDFALWPHMSVFENVAFGLRASAQTENLDAKVKDALHAVRLDDFAARYPHQLSGGQQQRVAFARAIVIEPKRILFDEPLSALDALLREDSCVKREGINKKKITSLLLASAISVSLAACGAAGTVADSSIATDAASVKVASSAAEAAPTQSAETAEAKSLSGKVTVYMPSPAGLSDKLAAGFKKATGVEVEVFQSTTGEILARLEAESANPVADVLVLASWSDDLSMKNDVKLMSYAPANGDKAVEGWIDSDSMLFGYSASAVGVIYNTTIFPTLSADWAELADAQYADQLAIPDPEKSGACKDFVAGYVNKNGWTDFEALAANGMTVPGANKAALEAVTTGEVGILVAGIDSNAYSSKAKGKPLDIYYPAGGTVVNPRPAMILNTAPNVDNAKAFIDYLYSDEAQAMVANAYLLPGRSDVTCDGRTNLADIPQIECDWDAMMGIASESAAKINEICSK